MGQSEDLNGEESNYEDNSTGNTVEEKRNIRSKFFTKYKLFDSIFYLIFQTLLTVSYFAIMVIWIISQNNTNLYTGQMNNHVYIRIERIFIVVFGVDTFIKILFHVNGYKFLKET